MTSIKLYNTLAHEKQDFTPIDENDVRLYSCGPTVYGDPHIGNARPAIVFDLLFRVLLKKYGADKVVYVRNITDVDDKINAQLRENALSLKKFTEAITARYHESLELLNVLPPTNEPKVSEHIDNIISLITNIVDNKFGYEKKGHVFFDVSEYKDYGALSRQDVNELIKGVRIEISEDKANPLDFVLWKPSDAETPGWDSPWGRGRPGWHIECSAMAKQYLGATFDIHAGGLDLIFPHHENEIAQSVCGNGAPFAKVWLHNGMINIDDEKMSKSLGNIVTIKSLLDEWDGNVLRFAMLTSHYRSIIDWNDKLLEDTSARLKKWSQSAKGVVGDEEPDDVFYESLFDDLNTPKAIAHLSSLHKKANKGDVVAANKLRAGAAFLGIELDYAGKQHSDTQQISDKEIEQLIEIRKTHKEEKEFEKADQIRLELQRKGVVLNDTPSGTTWSYSS